MTRLALAALVLVGCVAVVVYHHRWQFTLDGAPCGRAWPWEPVRVPKLNATRWSRFEATRPGETIAFSAKPGLKDYRGPEGTVEIYAGWRREVSIDWYETKSIGGPPSHPWVVFADLPGARFRFGCSGADDPRCADESGWSK